MEDKLSKKSLILPVLLFLLFSCGNKDINKNTADEAKEEKEAVAMDETIVDEAVIVEIKDAVNIYHELSYYKTPGKGAAGLLSAGDILQFTGTIQEDSAGKEYYEIVNNSGGTYWVLAYYIFPDTRPAVIKMIDEILLFNKDNDSSISNTEINPFRILAVDTEYENDVFSKIAWNIEDTYNVVYDKYIVTDDLSFNKADIDFAKIVSRYYAENHYGIKNELMNSMLSLKGLCSEFQEILESLSKDVKDFTVPDVVGLSLNYADVISITEDGGLLHLVDDAVITNSENFKFDLLDYLILETVYIDNSISFYIHNTSTSDLDTIPAEIEISNSGSSKYAGVLGSLKIESGKNVSFSLDGNIDFIDGIELNLRFVNGYVLKSSLIKNEGNE